MAADPRYCNETAFLYNQTLFSVSGLSNGYHTLRVEAVTMLWVRT